MNIRLAGDDVDAFSAIRVSGAATSFRISFEKTANCLAGKSLRTAVLWKIVLVHAVETMPDANVERNDYYIRHNVALRI